MKIIDRIFDWIGCDPGLKRNRDIARNVKTTRELSPYGSRLAVLRGTSSVVVLIHKVDDSQWLCRDFINCCDSVIGRRRLSVIDRDEKEDLELREKIRIAVQSCFLDVLGRSMLNDQNFNHVRGTSIYDMGGDTIDIIDILIGLEDSLGIELDGCEDLEEFTPVEIENAIWESIK